MLLPRECRLLSACTGDSHNYHVHAVEDVNLPASVVHQCCNAGLKKLCTPVLGLPKLDKFDTGNRDLLVWYAVLANCTERGVSCDVKNAGQFFALHETGGSRVCDASARTLCPAFTGSYPRSGRRPNHATGSFACFAVLLELPMRSAGYI